jgi:hypothetical protein
VTGQTGERAAGLGAGAYRRAAAGDHRRVANAFSAVKFIQELLQGKAGDNPTAPTC